MLKKNMGNQDNSSGTCDETSKWEIRIGNLNMPVIFLIMSLSTGTHIISLTSLPSPLNLCKMAFKGSDHFQFIIPERS